MKKFAVALVIVGLCTVVVQDASAQANFGLKGVGGRIGLVNVENLDSSFGFDAVADFGTLSPVIGVEGRVSYWGRTVDVGIAELKIRDITVGARGKYMFPTGNPISIASRSRY